MDRYRLPSLLAAALLVLGGCATEPSPARHSAPDSGFPYRAAQSPQFEEPPEPFVRTVDLSRLRVGMTKEEVLAIFPDPITINVSVRGLEVWEYGFAQLHFRQGLLANWFDLVRER